MAKSIVIRRSRAFPHRELLIATGTLAALLLLAFLFARGGASLGPPRVGAPMGDFELPNLEGETVRLSDYAGQVVLLNIWATWCPPCRAEMPALEAYYRLHREEGFVLLALNAGEPRDTAAAFIAEMGATFPVLLDPHNQTVSRMAVRNYPTSILIGADGMVKTVHIGLFTPQQLDTAVTPHLPR